MWWWTGCLTFLTLRLLTCKLEWKIPTSPFRGCAQGCNAVNWKPYVWQVGESIPVPGLHKILRRRGQAGAQEPMSPTSRNEPYGGLPATKGILRKHVIVEISLNIGGYLSPQTESVLLNTTWQAISHLPFSNTKHFILAWHCTVAVSLSSTLAW